jgi:hypothetical protein
MRPRFWTAPKLLAATLVLLTGVAVSAQPPSNPKRTTVKDPPGTGMYMDQFRLLFDKWDLNGDGYLDKDELAKAFRGPNAKPFDFVAPSKDGSEKDKSMLDKSEPDKTDPAKKDSESTKDPKDTKKPDYSKYPDYVFLTALDVDKDEKVSYDEFMHWAADYSTQLKQQADIARDLLKAQAELQKYVNKVNSADYRRALSALQHHQAQAQKAAAALARYEQKLAQKQFQSLARPK